MEHLYIMVAFFSHPKNLWGLASALMFLMVAVALVRIHFSDHKFDLIEVFAYDQKTGKVSDSKIRLNVAFIVSCWAFVYLVMADKFTEWYFFGFMGAWVTDRLFSRKSTNDSINQIQNNN